MVASDTFFATHSEQLAGLTVRHAVPAIHQSRDFAVAGGLISYAGSFVECTVKLASRPDVYSRVTSLLIYQSIKSLKSN